MEELSKANIDLFNLLASDVGILFLDRELRIHRFTPRAVDLFNVTESDLGRPITHLTHKSIYDGFEQDAERVLRDLVYIEQEVQARNGNWFLLRLRPYRTTGDQSDGVVVTFIDITERRRVEEAQRRSEERFRLLMENVKEYAIIMLDVDGNISTWNVGAKRLFGYAENEVVGQPADIIFTEEDRAMGAPEKEKQDARANGQAADERWHVRKDGSRFWGTGVMTSLYHPDGELRGFAKVMRDNTERKEYERSLEQKVIARTAQVRELASTLTMAEHQERRRLSVVLHDDLQQRLYGILMRLNLIRRDAEAGKTESVIAGVEKADEWIRGAMETTLQLTVDLSPPVLQSEDFVETLYWLRTQMKELHGLDVEVRGGQDFRIEREDMHVLLFQIVREMLFNVVKHAGTEKATVELYSSGDDFAIDVTDDGRGFDISEVLSKSRKKEGLGIFSIRERLGLFQGRLEIESHAGEGTRMRVYVPRDATLTRKGPAESAR